jgi:uncharacterized membrane protein YhaH (DUF805 family)
MIDSPGIDRPHEGERTMSFQDAVRSALTENYANFNGRARRSAYWYFALFAFIVDVVAFIIDQALGTYPLVYGLAVLALLLPGLGLGVRRLHDTNRSGWLILLGIIPIVGAIILLVFFVGEGTPGDNQYGPDPKGAPAPYAS